MSYIGNTPTQQNFVAGADQFSGNGSTTAFTLSRNVNTVFDIFVAVSNVPQDPYSAYSVSGNILTFTSAPPSGTGNIYVTYRATNVQTFVPTPGVSASFGDVTYTGTLTGSTGVVNIGSGQLYKDTSGNVGIGTTPSRKLDVSGTSSAGADIVARVTNTDSNASSRAAFQVKTGTSANVWQMFCRNNQLVFGIDTVADYATIDSTGNITATTFTGNLSGNATTVTNGMYTNASQTNTATKSFQASNSGMATGTGGLNTLEVIGTGGAAMMSFHRPGIFAAYLGIDTDNVWKVGGWSLGAAAYPLLYSTSSTAPGTAPVYAARAWVNFNGSSAGIRASGNVSSVSRNGTGDYTVNFSTAMTDANYSTTITNSWNPGSAFPIISIYQNVAPTTSSVRMVQDRPAVGVADSTYVNVAVFR